MYQSTVKMATGCGWIFHPRTCSRVDRKGERRAALTTLYHHVHLDMVSAGGSEKLSGCHIFPWHLIFLVIVVCL